MMAKVMGEIKLQTEPQRSISDSDKVKRGRNTGLHSDIDWIRRTQYSII